MAVEGDRETESETETEIDTADFGGHLFYDLFLQGPQLDPLLVMSGFQ